MKTIFFKKATEVLSSEILRVATGINEFYFQPGTVVNFKGRVTLAGGIHFRGQCRIEDGVSIDTGCVLNNVSIGTGSNIRSHSILNNSTIGKNNVIGPHCFIRDESSIGDSCIVGSHVEVARSKLGVKTKISHQAFVGDAIIDDRVIVGAGGVFCNFDGLDKQISEVGEDTIVGSGTMIVSPVKIGARVTIGAGSIVKKDIENDELFVQRRSR